jgi:hypothetical protein
MSKLFSLENYKVSKETIASCFEEHNTSEIAQLLENDKGYHYRIDPDKIYILYGDLDQKKDGKHTSWKSFREALIKFMKNEYDIQLFEQSFCYTKNSGKEGSHHYSIPELNCRATTLSKIMKKFKSSFQNFSDFVDTSIYGKHWWRLPNQTVSDKRTPHEVVTGKLRDFVIDLIPDNSRNIDDVVEEVVNEIEEELVAPEAEALIDNEELNVIRQFFDKCYERKRFGEYEYSEKFNLEENKNIWDGITNHCNHPITIATLYYYDRQDNQKAHSDILGKLFASSPDLSHNGVSK